jgi:tRNA-splicing ligase RtcB
MKLLYDVCHNIAKLETFPVDGEMMKLCVHRKAPPALFLPDIRTARALPESRPARADPRRYGNRLLRDGRYRKSLSGDFGSTCHGAGRVMSRAQATRASAGRRLQRKWPTGE